MTKPLVSVVIPFYNEAENVPLLAAKLRDAAAGLPQFAFEYLFVNDGSTDGTRLIIHRLAAKDSAFRLVDLARNSGQSAALFAGFDAAHGEFVLTLDGDLQNDPADFTAVLKLLETHDFVAGYRTERHDSWLRKVSSTVANRVRNAVLQDGLRDTGCGLKGFRRESLPLLIPFNGAHRFFGAVLRRAGVRIAECPVAHHPREHGVSKYGVRNRAWRGLLDLAGVCWLQKRYISGRIRFSGESAAGVDHGIEPVSPDGTGVFSDGGRTHVFLLTALLLILVIPPVLLRDLWPPDEPRYAEVTQEMMRTGDYLTPRLNDEPYLEKPPLLFWLMALSSWPVGHVTEISARIPSVLSAFVTVLLTYALGVQLFGRRVAFWAGVVLLTNTRIWIQASNGQIDMLLAACLMLSLYAFWNWDLSRKPIWILLFYAGIAAGLYAKGPPALIWPAGLILAYYWGRRTDRRRIHPVLGMVAALGIFAVWLLPARGEAATGSEANAVDMLSADIYRQVIGRLFLGVSHAHGPLYYVERLPIDLFPWTLFLPWTAYYVWKHRRDGKRMRLLLSWLLPAFVLFTLITTKRQVYLVPLFPVMAILMAASAMELADGVRARWRRNTAIVWVACLVLIGAFPFAILVTDYAEAFSPILAALSCTALLFTVQTIRDIRRGGARSLPTLIGSQTAVIFVLVGVLAFPIVDRYKSARHFMEPVRTLAQSRTDLELYMVGFFRAEYLYYSGLPRLTTVLEGVSRHGTRDEESGVLKGTKASPRSNVAVAAALSPDVGERGHTREDRWDPQFARFRTEFISARPAIAIVRARDWEWLSTAFRPDEYRILRSESVGSREMLLIGNTSCGTLATASTVSPNVP